MTQAHDENWIHFETQWIRFTDSFHFLRIRFTRWSVGLCYAFPENTPNGYHVSRMRFSPRARMKRENSPLSRNGWLTSNKKHRPSTPGHLPGRPWREQKHHAWPRG